MNSADSNRSITKRTYEAPKLTTYGSVRELTAGSGGNAADPSVNKTKDANG